MLISFVNSAKQPANLMHNPFSFTHTLCCVLGILIHCNTFAQPLSEQDIAREYLHKYNTYLFWSEHLPDTPHPEFMSFLEPVTPLTQKLREKWLFHLARRQDWTLFNLYYRPTDDEGLLCYAQMARYQLGQQSEAIQSTLPLWLSPTAHSSLPCRHLFALLQHDHALSPQHIEQRIAQALGDNHIAAAQELLVHLGASYVQTATMLKRISRNPRDILHLQPGPLSGALYLYGLNLMLKRNLNTAITLWQHPHSTKLLQPEQAQQFLAHLALYKAMRHEPDAEEWFAKVQPIYCNAQLRDWEIRYALMQKNWKKIAQITATVTLEQNEPFLLYWRARALDHLDQPSKAQAIYQTLALKRSYYGFLASISLRQAYHFEFEPTHHDPSVLAIYKPITDQIAEYHRSNQSYLAAHTLNEFSLELPKSHKSALVYWVAHHLRWHGKAIYLSTQDEILKNQLVLRFPLTYQEQIQKLANQYQVSPALIYATVRQESTFMENIKSEAGAYGLMQILPSTAKHIARHAKIPYSEPKDLFYPEKNLHIGVAYLHTLHQQFKAHPVLMMAAYNAGPKQVRRWVNDHSPRDIDIWIETLPWQETRDYLKNVISFYAVYQYRMQQKPNLAPFLQPFSDTSYTKA